MKCLPILFGINVKDDFPIFFGCFYKFLYYCKKNNWPILAQEEYFIDPKYYEKNFNINLNKIAKINEIPELHQKMFDEVDKYTIFNEETQLVLKNYKSKDDAWINLMNDYDKTLASIIAGKIKLIKSKYNDLKYIFLWRHNETICKVAKKYGLETIEMELSGIRKPSYNFGLNYFQFSNKYDDSELNYRYEKFIKETKNNSVPILSRKELINLLLTKEEINNLCEEEYDVGIALGLKKDYETLSTDSITNEEILLSMSNFEKNKNIIIRKHPANYDYKYDKEDLYTIDNSVSSVQFVSKCRKIISSVSNIGLEAMLLGKTSYTLGKMPFKRFAYTTLEYNDEYVINVRDLNYLIFCYYAPYSLSLTDEYIKFRSENPSEVDIYMYHYNYIMRNYKNTDNNYAVSIRENCLKRRNIILNLNKNIEEKNNEINKLKYDNDIYLKEINNIINSKSWKITKILRVLNQKNR